LFVFVVVTLFVALGIAAAQGCEGPSRGLGGDSGVVREQPQGQVHAPPPGTQQDPRRQPAGGAAG